ncbi:hypothetical protein PMAYCL1PPCAC_10359, partial [Pristionchus mayeri]
RRYLLRHTEIALNALLRGLHIDHWKGHTFLYGDLLTQQFLSQFTDGNVLLQEQNFDLGAARPVHVPKILEEIRAILVHVLRQFLHILLRRHGRVFPPIQLIHMTNEIRLGL